MSAKQEVCRLAPELIAMKRTWRCSKNSSDPAGSEADSAEWDRQKVHWHARIDQSGGASAGTDKQSRSLRSGTGLRRIASSSSPLLRPGCRYFFSNAFSSAIDSCWTFWIFGIRLVIRTWTRSIDPCRTIGILAITALPASVA